MGQWTTFGEPGTGPTPNDDTYVGDDTDEIVDGLGGGDTLYGRGGNDQLNGGINGNDNLHGEDGNDTLLGGHGNDTLLGGAGIDILYGDNDMDELRGGAGDDFMYGGESNDAIFADGGSDTIDGGAGNDGVLVDWSAETLGAHVEIVDPTMLTTLFLGGAAHGTVINVERLNFIGGSGNDYAVSRGDYSSLVGGAGNDTLIANGLNDTLEGGAGDDYMDGGATGDSDYIDYTNAPAGVTIDLSITTAQNTGSVGFDTILNIEHVLGSAFDDVLYGDANGNALYGNEGSDEVYGRGGPDLIWLRDGDDYAEGGDNYDQIQGGQGDDTIYGGGGDDRLDGEEGVDALYGEDGDDWLSLQYGVNVDDDPGEFADGGAGNDRIGGSQRADLLLGGDGNDDISGGLGADLMYGGAGNDAIDLAEWTSEAYPFPEWIRDTAYGEDGDDHFVIAWGDTAYGGANTEFGDTAVIFLRNPFDVFEGVSLDLRGLSSETGFAITGGGFISGIEHVFEFQLSLTDDLFYDTDAGTVIAGSGGDDIIYGMGGDDILDGGGLSIDYLYGGEGDDTYIVRDGFKYVFEDADAGIDTVQSRTTYTLPDNVENLVLVNVDSAGGAHGNNLDNILIGNDFMNALTGADGHDVLDGGANTDFLTGGAGDDLYVVDRASDVVTELAGEGWDVVYSYVTYTLPDHVEDLVLIEGAAINGAGNELSNIIIGNGDDNGIDGGGGADIIEGDGGNDTLSGNGGSDTLDGGAGDDFLYGHSDGASGTITSTVFATGLALPVAGAVAPGDPNYLYILEKDTGIIWRTDIDTGARTQFLDIPQGDFSRDGEGGALGLAFHPDYAANGRFFVFLTDTNGDLQVREFARNGGDGDPPTAGTSSTLVIEVGHPVNTNHNAGWIEFSPTDGYLYIATGDGGGAGDPNNNAQNVNSLLGKILRIDVDSGDAFPADPNKNYANPNTNPFFGATAGADEIWHYGLRNPFRAAFDPRNGDLYIGDVGQTAREEIDYAANGVGGLNFGWRLMEGTQPYPPGSPDPNNPALIDPVFDYGRDIGTTVTGGEVYVGSNASFTGTYVFSDYGSDRIFTLRVENGVGYDAVDRTGQISGPVPLNVVDFVSDSEGNLYAIGLFGTIWRLTPSVGAEDVGDVLIGGAGNDWLDGNFGADQMTGGTDNDTYVVDNAGDVVTELANEGNDTVRSSLTYTLSANLENLTLLGAANLNGFGNAAVNILTGNTGNNFIQGFAGADTINGGDGDDWLDGGEGGDIINGGAGFDIAAFGSSPVGVNIDLQSGVYSGGEAAGETLTGIEGLSGSSFDDQIFGNANANTLYGQGGFDFIQGRDGNDTLEGGAGNDWLDGGAGADIINGGDGIRDTAAYGSSIAAVNVDLEAGIYSGGDAAGDTLIGIEWLSGSAWNDNLFGSASINTLFGQGGADFMQGRGGDDTLEGGEGNDWLDGGAGSDIINGGNGSDTAAYGASGFAVNLDLQSGVYTGGHAAGDTLISIENLSGSGLADNLFGNANANVLHGQGGADFMQGRGGADTLNGGEGNDWLDGGAGADAINGGNGTDTAAFGASASAVTLDLQAGAYSGGDATGDTLTSIENLSGSGHADTLLGNASANTLFGQGGADTLNGRGGNDVLNGGAGNDLFVFGVGDGDDTISDFTAGGTDDSIDLSAYNGSGVTWTVNQVGGNTVFDFSNGDSVTLLNVTATNLVYDGMFGYS